MSLLTELFGERVEHVVNVPVVPGPHALRNDAQLASGEGGRELAKEIIDHFY